jgi:large subunit ribosomal protein L18
MKKDRNERRQVIHRRIRRRVSGSSERPRLAVYRTLNHIYVQAIDDAEGKTLAQASTLDGSLKGQGGGNVSAAKAVGSLIAERLKALGVEQAIFDRGGYLYHGRIKALAEAAREGGIQF